MRVPVLILMLAAAVVSTLPCRAAACMDSPAHRSLDFWIGDWAVRIGDVTVGHDRIERALDGCAVLEHWSSERGGRGMSLFWIDPVEGGWRQVWVTSNAGDPGGTKEKRQVSGDPSKGVVMLGTRPGADGGTLLDRTTLAPRPDGTVRQIIETSSDGGTTWEVSFDAVYVREREASGTGAATRGPR